MAVILPRLLEVDRFFTSVEPLILNDMASCAFQGFFFDQESLFMTMKKGKYYKEIIKNQHS